MVILILISLLSSGTGIIGFTEPSVEVKQTEGRVVLKIQRVGSTRGRAIVPWDISTESADTIYEGANGHESFKDGEEDSHIEIELSQLPQDGESSQFR